MKRAALFLTMSLFFGAGSAAWGARNTLAPNGKIFFNLPEMGDCNAFSLLGEFGEKVVRGNGTYGDYINPRNRIKFSGELLLQKLAYKFSNGIERKWMTQYAVGGEYQYLFLYELLQSIDFSTSFSHAFSRGATSDPTPGRVSSSDVVTAYLGTTMNVWDCGYFSVGLNYDFAHYMRHHQHSESANGFGGTIKLLQYLPLDFSLEGEADFRRPFYYYSGVVNWHRNFDSCALDLGAYVNYTNGQEHVPNTLAAGIQLGLSFGASDSCCKRPQQQQKAISFTDDCESRAYCSLSEWVAKPAIYMPMVLAIKDQSP